ncbi:MAG: dTMP kinase [Lentisphaerae bacterium RIFOXYA12_FULL_48_11]|nr:MAG: dTMP kinase [Lentisphaerae bacterium RIFOXYA12_FULL_48_11]
MKGLFITFEGPEGGGKSTHAARLALRLRDLGYDVVATREPGGTPAGEAIRNVIQHDQRSANLSSETETLLFLASRAQLVRSIILPALKKGCCVICDRFTDSTIAYQGYGRGLDIQSLFRLNKFATGESVPDLTLLLDLDVKSGFMRLRERNRKNNAGHDRIERESMMFHEKVRRGYLKLAGKWPRRFRIIDAAQSMKQVEESIWAVVCKRLGRLSR